VTIKAPLDPDDPNSPTGKVEAWSQGGGRTLAEREFRCRDNTIILSAPAIPRPGMAGRVPPKTANNLSDYGTASNLRPGSGVDPTVEVKWFYQHNRPTRRLGFSLATTNLVRAVYYQDKAEPKPLEALLPLIRNRLFLCRLDAEQRQGWHAFPFAQITSPGQSHHRPGRLGRP